MSEAACSRQLSSVKLYAPSSKHMVSCSNMIIKNRLGKPLLEVESTSDHLEGVVLVDANLPEADLRGADLYEAYLPGANLTGADLRAANLRGATLREANLQNADLSGADLSLDNINNAADLCGANLKGALLEDAYLYGAEFDTLTIWPDGYTPDTKTKDNGRPDVR